MSQLWELNDNELTELDEQIRNRYIKKNTNVSSYLLMRPILDEQLKESSNDTIMETINKLILIDTAYSESSVYRIIGVSDLSKDEYITYITLKLLTNGMIDDCELIIIAAYVTKYRILPQHIITYNITNPMYVRDNIDRLIEILRRLTSTVETSYVKYLNEVVHNNIIKLGMHKNYLVSKYNTIAKLNKQLGIENSEISELISTCIDIYNLEIDGNIVEYNMVIDTSLVRIRDTNLKVLDTSTVLYTMLLGYNIKIPISLIRELLDYVSGKYHIKDKLETLRTLRDVNIIDIHNDINKPNFDKTILTDRYKSSRHVNRKRKSFLNLSLNDNKLKEVLRCENIIKLAINDTRILLKNYTEE